MADEPTPWELKRNYDSLRADMRDGFNQINSRLDKMPSSEVFTALLGELQRRVHDVEQDFASDQQSRKSDRRIVIGAALAAAGAIVTQIVTSILQAKGVG